MRLMLSTLYGLLVVTGCVEGEAAKAPRGEIFTTTSVGKRVDVHLTPTAAYLDGGGKLAAGDYFFQVTDATGATLLSSDHISCRRFRISEDGMIVHAYRGTHYDRVHWAWQASECQHATGVDHEYASLGAITVRLAPFAEATKGEYKVWVTPIGEYLGDPNLVPDADDESFPALPGVHGFAPAHSKVETFRVRLSREL